MRLKIMIHGAKIQLTIYAPHRAINYLGTLLP